MEYWDYTDNMNKKEEPEVKPKMEVCLEHNNDSCIIIYNDTNVGKVIFKNVNNTIADIEIYIDSFIYQNRGIGTKAIKEACILAKDELKLTKLKAKILKDDSKCQLVFFKNHFDLAYSMDEYLVLEKKL